MTELPGYQLWLNSERTVMVRVWDEGTIEVAFRDHARHLWGPPIEVVKEASP